MENLKKEIAILIEDLKVGIQGSEKCLLKGLTRGDNEIGLIKASIILMKDIVHRLEEMIKNPEKQYYNPKE